MLISSGYLGFLGRRQRIAYACRALLHITLPTYLLSSGRMANIGMTDGSARAFTGSSFLSHLDCIHVPPCLLYQVVPPNTLAIQESVGMAALHRHFTCL